MQVLVRDNNVDQALKALKKKMQREGIFREMKLRGHYEKPSEKKAREKAEAVRRARKLARKKLQREGLMPMKPKDRAGRSRRPWRRQAAARRARRRLRWGRGLDFIPFRAMARAASGGPRSFFGRPAERIVLPDVRQGPRMTGSVYCAMHDSGADRAGGRYRARVRRLSPLAGCSTVGMRRPRKTTTGLRRRAGQHRLAQRGRATQPNDPQAYNMRGSVFGQAGRNDEALADFNKAISLDPNYAQAYANRGLIYRKTGKLDLALADYNKALTLDPNYAAAYLGRGIVYRPAQAAPEAFNDFNKAIAIRPDNAEAYYNRGLLYQSQRQHQFAIDDFSTAIGLTAARPSLLSPAA